jgi:phenylacetaldehyde dehydrogenase
VAQSCSAVFFNAGQVCIAGTRTFVHSSIYDRFVEAVTKQVKAIRLGHSLDPKTDQGPLVSKVQMNRVLGYIE